MTAHFDFDNRVKIDTYHLRWHNLSADETYKNHEVYWLSV